MIADRLAVALDRRACPPRIVRRQLHRMAGGVDVAAALGQPVGEAERRVAEGVGQRVAQVPPPAVAFAELGHQAPDPVGALDVASQQAGEEGERNRGEHEEARVVDLALDGVPAAGEVGDEGERDHGGHEPAGDRDRRIRAPLRSARPTPALHEEDAEHGDRDRPEERLQRQDGLGGRL